MLINRMATDLGISARFIRRISKSIPFYYKWYKIPKKSGGSRLIYQPSPSLKVLQYWLIENIFNLIPVSEHATAYSKGASTIKNAKLHHKKKHLLHLDITNFFPSIRSYHVIELLNKHQDLLKSLGRTLSGEDIELICKLVLYKDGLTIGSPSSPIISNIVMAEADLDINKIAASYNCIYSRYADDMVFSSEEHIDVKIIEEVQSILSEFGFELNLEKTYYMGPKERRIVTGIVVSNDRLTIGRKSRDEIKKMVYMYVTYNRGDRKRIQGYLNYLKSVDPTYHEKIVQKYPDFFGVCQ